MQNLPICFTGTMTNLNTQSILPVQESWSSLNNVIRQSTMKTYMDQGLIPLKTFLSTIPSEIQVILLT